MVTYETLFFLFCFRNPWILARRTNAAVAVAVCPMPTPGMAISASAGTDSADATAIKVRAAQSPQQSPVHIALSL